MAFSKLFKKMSVDETEVEEDKTETEVFYGPWRELHWDKSQIVEELIDFSLSNPEVKQLRLLMCGPVGAGKSSFVNSVNSAFQCRVTNKASMSTSSARSCTNKYRGYKIKNGQSGTLSFMFFDTMGLENEDGDGVHPVDLISALQGNIPDGYEFKPQKYLTCDKEGFISKPSQEEKIHCLICVVSGNSISQMPKRTIQKMKDVIREASGSGIPQVVIMTMVDRICPVVKNDLKEVYTSKQIKKKMEECSEMLSVPMACIFPVKNYHEEIETNDDMDVLLLSAMRQIVHFANDYTEII